MKIEKLLRISAMVQTGIPTGIETRGESVAVGLEREYPGIVEAVLDEAAARGIAALMLDFLQWVPTDEERAQIAALRRARGRG
jgi:hypothetical protein